MRCSWILYALLTTVAAPALAADDWVVVGESTSDDEFAIKSGTGQVSTNGDGETIVTAVGRIRIRAPSNASSTIERWTVRARDCQQGYGTFLTETLDGRPKQQADFAIDGGNVASMCAKFLCALGAYIRDNPR